LSEDTQIGQYNFKKDHIFFISIIFQHHNPKEWIEPEKYIPERFSPKSPYYLTPDGKKRHAMSYGPFLGGKRICIGKTFAETSSKLALAIIFSRYSFKFMDKKNYSGKIPIINLVVKKVPEIFVEAQFLQKN